MEKRYKVVFIYPDGHIEEIDQTFEAGREALEYGNSMLVQVANNEQFHSNKASFDDDFFSNEPIEPYFMIVEIDKKKYHLVYDSRRK